MVKKMNEAFLQGAIERNRIATEANTLNNKELLFFLKELLAQMEIQNRMLRGDSFENASEQSRNRIQNLENNKPWIK